MATDLIMPTLPDQRLQSQYFATAYPVERPHLSHNRSQSYQYAPTEYSQHQNQQQTSPLNSGHGSPTSPGGGRMHGSRQNRPLFVPAVLRPTNFNTSTTTLLRSPKNENGPDGEDLTLRRVSSSFISLPGLSMFGSRLSRRSTGDSGKGFTDDDLDPELFPEVTGEPRRNHWKPDPHATACDEPSCKRSFNYFYRRHHCRKCGNIFCDPHTSFTIPLDEDCNYNPRGSPSRACSHCFSEFLAWKSRNNSRAGSDQGSVTDGDRAVPRHMGSKSTPASPINGGSPVAAGATLAEVRGPEVAASVPRDWNWSTF